MKHSITVELDDETVRSLTVLGEPTHVLADLAFSAADGVCRADHPKRVQTSGSLRAERDKSDAALAKERAAIEDEADDVAPIALWRVDQVGRVERRSQRARFLAREREVTDQDLRRERAHADTLISAQREANEHMVGATIRAQELTVEADTAKKRAEEGERELRAVAEFREMFIGILGHDLRNPLGAIGLGTSLLQRRGYLQQQDQKAITLIVNSTGRMTRMTTQLLDLTRARLGDGLPIEPKPSDLGEVCRSVVDEFAAPIRLVIEGDLTGTWDQDRLAEVLSNLLGNAVEYADPGTVVILEAAADGAEVVVQVRNQGEPIPAAVLPSLFSPFRRGRQREKSATGNLGLGLYIAQQIVLSHGGTLDAHSADHTTTFVMRLPRIPPPRADRKRLLDR